MPNSPASADSSSRGTIGLLLVRVVVPMWVLLGACFKLAARDPKLLPEPVRNVSLRAADFLSIPEPQLGAFLDTTLRFVIGTEFLLIVLMIFVPRLSRAVAIFMLSVFLLVLVGVLTANVQNVGIKGLLKGDCGCFGSGGPPPIAMFCIDALLLAGVLFCKPVLRWAPKALGAAVATALGGVAAYAVAFGVPAKALPNVTPTPPTLSSWPAAPPLDTTYFLKFESWIGKPLREQELALQITRPLPDGLDQGMWHVVLYRGDCEHCHELLETHMASRAERTIAVRVPDTDLASDLPMPQAKFHLHGLPDGPNYVFTTPVLLTIVDGVVKAAVTDSEDEAAVQAALAGRAKETTEAPKEAAPPTAPATPAESEPAAPPTPPATAGAASWPPAPALESTYFPKFEVWKGQRLDSQPLALQLAPKEASFKPASLNTGRWHLLFYRGDCDHCHELMQYYLVGDLESRVVAIRVPDTELASELPMPLTNAVMAAVPKGPNYVFTTPVLMTLSDGIIVGLALDPENDAEVRACLEAK